jgi:hypothetical protein
MAAVSLTSVARSRELVAKLGTQVRAQSWVVYTGQGDAPLVLQSDKAIATIDPSTRKGLINKKGKYFVDLAPHRGAVPFVAPPEVVAQALAIRGGYEYVPTTEGDHDD